MMTGTSGRAALAFGSSSRPVIPGMFMSERIRINDAPAASLINLSALSADCAKSIVKRPSRMSRLNCWRNSASTSGSLEKRLLQHGLIPGSSQTRARESALQERRRPASTPAGPTSVGANRETTELPERVTAHLALIIFIRAAKHDDDNI